MYGIYIDTVYMVSAYFDTYYAMLLYLEIINASIENK